MGKKNRIKHLFDKAAIEPSNTQPRSTERSHADQESEETTLENLKHELMETPGQSEETSLSGETQTEITESAPEDLQDEGSSSETRLREEDESAARESEETPISADEQETSSDDILDDVRRSLMEEETQEKQKESRWWRRIGRKGRKPEPEAAPVPIEIDLPAIPEPLADVEAPEQKEEKQEERDEIEDLIQMLEDERHDAAQTEVVPQVETAAEPEPEIDFDELKKQAFQPRSEGAESQDITEVRSIALEGGEDVLVEVESKRVDPMEERIRGFENALKPYRRYIYAALTLLGVGMAVVASLILFNIYQQSRPVSTREPSNLPYPVAVSLPGGWSFQLGTGTVQNGRWDPRGAEWLEGTEVCRWVALPWSTQLEAVIRTLNPKDPIELTMSNNDKLVYEVYSIRELSLEQLQQVDSNSPCLLVILTQSDSENRWVLTALP